MVTKSTRRSHRPAVLIAILLAARGASHAQKGICGLSFIMALLALLLSTVHRRRRTVRGVWRRVVSTFISAVSSRRFLKGLRSLGLLHAVMDAEPQFAREERIIDSANDDVAHQPIHGCAKHRVQGLAVKRSARRISRLWRVPRQRHKRLSV